MNSITRGYYENEPEYLKLGAKVGTQAFIAANQNIKIGDGSSKVSDETLAKAASSTIGQVVATGNFKMVPTKDKEYENNNKGVQKQVKVAKVEAKRKTRNSKDKDYYVRVDGKNKTVTVEETKRPKGYGSYLYKSLVLDPIESFHNFHETKKAAFHGNIGGAFKNTLKGIGNLTSPFTLGVGSWAGDNYARFKPEEVQYGTREEVLKRKQTESTLVSLPIDMAVGSAVSKVPIKKIIPVKSTTVKKTTHSSYKSSTFMTPENYYNVKSQNGISYNTQQSIIKNYGNIIDDDYIVRNPDYTYQKNSRASNFDFNHILHGETNSSGTRGKGGHLSFSSPNVRVENIIGNPDRNGVTRVEVKIYNSTKNLWAEKKVAPGEYHTAFPRDWSESKAIWEINGAWNSSDFKVIDPIRNIWQGTSPSGIKIRGYINDKTLAYPLYEGGIK